MSSPGNKAFYIRALERNRLVFSSLFSGLEGEIITWKKDSESWCILEIVCHLYDEEREDFRRRVQHVINGEEGLPPGINPAEWVKSRSYMDQDFNEKVRDFNRERLDSLAYLRTMDISKAGNSFEHPSLGTLNGFHFLDNWVAHDYLHQRQLVRVCYDFLANKTDTDLSYAGRWK